ncbi:MAG: response regulator transcription factor, partial [Candidatus Gastranaerophilales bacterium]|nr:response regulator transcription factor [Candidatus Gastranaerophilales bacterium]
NIDYSIQEPPIEIIVKKDFVKHFLAYLESLEETNTKIIDLNLTKRELEVLECLTKGFNNKEIAKQLNVSVHTTKIHIHNIFSKLNVQDRTEAVVKAIKEKIIEL